MQFGFNLPDKNACTECCCCCDKFTLSDLLSNDFLYQGAYVDGYEANDYFIPFVVEWTPPRSIGSYGEPVRVWEQPCDGPGADLPPPQHNVFVKCNDLPDPASNPCCKEARRQKAPIVRGKCVWFTAPGGVFTENCVVTEQGPCFNVANGAAFTAGVGCAGEEIPPEEQPTSYEWACPAGKWRPWNACLRFLCRCVRSDGSVVCSKEYGGPTVNELDLTELFLEHFGPEPEPGCYIYEAQFFGWRRNVSTYGTQWNIPGGQPDPSCDAAREVAGWHVNDYCTYISRDDAYCLFRGKIGENCGRRPRGACCGECSCTRTYESECDGTWYENTSCLEVECGQGTGSCCQPDGSCSITTACDCGGIWTENELCAPNPCPQPTEGACCDGVNCTQTTQMQCDELWGTWSEGVSCYPNPCSPP